MLVVSKDGEKAEENCRLHEIIAEGVVVVCIFEFVIPVFCICR